MRRRLKHAGAASAGRRLDRRTLLAGSAVLTAGLLLRYSARAMAAEVSAGDLRFTVPTEIAAVAPQAPWQWQGEKAGPHGVPAVVVLARADLSASAPQELQTLLFAPQLTGRLPGLRLDDAQLISTGDTTELRQPFTYAPTAGVSYTGTALFATGSGHAGILVVVGTADVATAGLVDTILTSARFTG